jgi:AcrR family transcriptional regulator
LVRLRYHREMSLSRQEDILTGGRQNQKQRTREALLDAAVRLARAGQSPAIAEVAEAARVSIATAYRYFPNPASLWADLATRMGPEMLGFMDDLPVDVEARIDTVVRKIADFQFGDEVLWRTLLRASLDRWFSQNDLNEDEQVPVRGTTRVRTTRQALAPLEKTLPPEIFERLTSAVLLVYGLEAMVVARDAAGLDVDGASDVMSWAAKALVRAAIAEAESAS